MPAKSPQNIESILIEPLAEQTVSVIPDDIDVSDFNGSNATILETENLEPINETEIPSISQPTTAEAPEFEESPTQSIDVPEVGETVNTNIPVGVNPINNFLHTPTIQPILNDFSNELLESKGSSSAVKDRIKIAYRKITQKATAFIETAVDAIQPIKNIVVEFISRLISKLMR
jgi:hypothetical protein